MDVINFTSRKRETYAVQLKYSILWECALGIAAITNKPIIDTLEISKKDLKDFQASFSNELIEELEHVAKNNTWKALLQLLHIKDFPNLKEFKDYLNDISENEFKFICLPFIGQQYQDIRKSASLQGKTAIDEMKRLTNDNSFFPSYIEFITKADGDSLKAHLINVIEKWYEAVIKKDEKNLIRILQTDLESKNKMREKVTSEELVEWATGGVTYLPEPSVSNVLLIPQYIYRPWTIEADIEGTKVFYYPVANESIHPSDRYIPNQFLILKHKALGDEVRLRIVKLLYAQDRSLQEITGELNMGKSTVHHHLKILRAAKLVEILDSKYSLKKKGLESLSKALELYLKQ